MKATDLRVDFQMQLAHAWDDSFFALCVKVHSKGWIFSGESVNGFGEFILIILAGGKEINYRLEQLFLSSINWGMLVPCWTA